MQINDKLCCSHRPRSTFQSGQLPLLSDDFAAFAATGGRTLRVVGCLRLETATYFRLCSEMIGNLVVGSALQITRMDLQRSSVDVDRVQRKLEWASTHTHRSQTTSFNSHPSTHSHTHTHTHTRCRLSLIHI